MKKLTFVILLTFFGMVAFAQPKLLEKSGRKPGWINGIEKDYIIVSGS